MPYKQSPGRMNMPKTGRDIPMNMINPTKHTGKKVKVTTASGKEVELDTRSSEYKSLIAKKKKENVRSGVGIKGGLYTGMSETGDTQM